MKAKQIVILTPNMEVSKKKVNEDKENEGTDGKEEEKDSKDSENLLDAKTIFKYNIIKKKKKDVNVVTELVNQENIAFLLDDPLLYHFMRAFDYDQTPVFASGEVYLSSLMDCLVCQAYYNNELLIVLRQMIIGEAKKSNSSSSKRIKIQDTSFSHVPTSNLYHIKVPEKYVGKKYSKLFDALTTRMFMIPMGLYRTTEVNLKAYAERLPQGLSNSGVKVMNGDKKNKQKEMKKIKYVVTNPDKETRLRDDDLVFVLAKSDPGDPNTWDDYNDNNKYMFDSN